METSLSIHPDRFTNHAETPYYSPGKALHMEAIDGGGALQCERGKLYIRFYTDEIVRVVYDPKGRQLNHYRSHAVHHPPENVDVQRETTETVLQLHSAKLTVQIDISSARVTIIDRKSGKIRLEEPENGMLFSASGAIICRKISESEERYYGFGEKAGFLDKRGERLEMWNTDVYAPHNPETDPLYVSIPYYLAMRGNEGYGMLFDNTYRCSFDMKHDKEIRYQADGGVLNYYYLNGPGPKDVLAQLAKLTGTAPLPPKWSLGYHQSRYSYETEREVYELVDQFVSKGIPLDAVYLDIHYMDGYRVFTIDRDRFPDFEGMVRALKEKGIRVVTIIDPGVKADPEYRIYQEGIQQNMFCKYIEGQVFHGDVWPGKSAFPDFTSDKVRKWWGEQHRILIDSGVSGIWNDMNEPSVFNESKTMDLEVIHDNDGQPGTHRELHNIYGLQMSRATYESLKQQLNGKRPFVLTRAGYAGIQKYAAVWTGDNRSFWEHLQMMIPMMLNLGLSGVPFTGADIGGFAHDTQADLLVRWTQAAVFTPYFRNHSEYNSARQEPWVFGEKTEQLVREAIQLRYRWLPQLYLLMEEASRTGIPPMRPLFVEFPDDQEAYRICDQFMFGENVLVAPILRPDTSHRAVYLPQGEWIDYWTDERYQGGRHILAHAAEDRIPIWIKAGSATLEESARASTAQPAEELKIHLYISDEGFTYRLYDDDGETFNREDGSYFEAIGHVEWHEGRLSIQEKVIHEGWKPEWNKRSIVVHSDLPIDQVYWNDKLLTESRRWNSLHAVEYLI